MAGKGAGIAFLGDDSNSKRGGSRIEVPLGAGAILLSGDQEKSPNFAFPLGKQCD